MTTPILDRVIQQVNNYQKEVFNGDLGTIVSIDLEEQEVVVQFSERMITYDYADLRSGHSSGQQLSERSLQWRSGNHRFYRPGGTGSRGAILRAHDYL